MDQTTTGPKLTAERVNEIILACLYTNEEAESSGPVPPGAILVDGVANRFGFHPERLASHKEEIRSMLMELPVGFRESSGGGWSVLNGCHRQDGEQWGQHLEMDALFSLGIACGLAKFLMPRELWSSLPGGMPYVAVLDKAV
jgi:hypothetical protein